MIKQTGTVTSYKELGEQFLDFVQQSNDTTESWEVIDDRLDSFYGATIKFPVSSLNVGNIIKNKVPTLSCNAEEIQAFEVPCFWWCGSLEKIKLDTYGINDQIWYSYPEGYTNGHELYFFDDLINVLYGVTPSDYALSDYLYGNYNVLDRHIYTESSHTSDMSKLFKQYDNIDPLYTVFLQYDDADFSKLINKKHIIIICNVSTIFYYLDYEDSMFFKLALYLKSIKYRLEQKLVEMNPDISVEEFHVDILFCYFPMKEVDLTVVDERLVFTDDSSQALYNYLSYMQTEFKDNFYFINLLDILEDSQRNAIKNQILSVSNKLCINDIGHVRPKYINSDYSYINFIKDLNYNINMNNLDFGASSVNVDNVLSSSRVWRWDISYNVIYSFISHNDYLENNFLTFNVENKFYYGRYAYISLQYNKITPTTYNEWLTNTKDNYMSESFDSRRRIPAYYNNAETWRTVTISNQYQNDVPNIFKDTGEVLFISPHIKYDKNLWMCEQGGIACDQETRTQNIEDNCIRHRKLTSNFSGYATQQFVKVPPFPSLGCPMFTINSSQLSQEKINYYFIRDNNNASIVVYVPTPDSMTYSYVVQHMSFGVLDSFSISEQFMYPLYVCGGNGGLYQDHWTYYSPGSGVPSHEVGNIYKLDMENITMSNSNILLSARFNGANVSNFRVLCPDGHWDNIFNVSQNVSLIVDPDQCWPDSWTPRYYLLQQPVVGGSELGDVRYGGTTTLNGANSIKRIDTGYIIPEYRATQTVDYSKTFHANAVIQPVMPVFSSHKLVSSEGWPRHRYGIIGKIPRCYSTWSRHLKFGELEIGGKKFLSIPSAYDYRIWYPAYKTKVDLANLEANVKSDANTDNVMYNKYIYDYLLLKLED